MVRPKLWKLISQYPKVTFYKPQGIPLRNLQTLELTHEEWEVLRLKYIKNLDQNSSAQVMQTSRSTVQRILSSAQKKIGQAIVQGKAIKILKN